MSEPEAPPSPAPTKPSPAPVVAAVIAGVAAGLFAGFVTFDRSREIQALKGDVSQARKEAHDSLASARLEFDKNLTAARNEAREEVVAAKTEARAHAADVRAEAQKKIDALQAQHDLQVRKLEAEVKRALDAGVSPRSSAPLALFNGKDLDGWEGVGGPLDNWKVEEGLLVCTGGKGSRWISTKEQFGDFELSLEFKLSEGGNSGLFIRTPRQGDPAYVGMELQIIDDEGYEIKHNAKLKDWQKTASIYAVVAPAKSTVKKAGEWNHMRARAEGRLISVWVNGIRVIDADTGGYVEGKPPLKERPLRGYIGLQNHGARLEFRNIQLRKLD
jgi:hypothetical protein